MIIFQNDGLSEFGIIHFVAANGLENRFILEMETKFDITDRNLATIKQTGGLVDGGTIDKRSIAAFQVHDEKHAVVIGDISVVATHRSVIDNDITLRVSANNDGLPTQVDLLSNN